MLKQNLYYFLGSNRKQELKELYTKLKTLYEERANIEVLKKEREEKLKDEFKLILADAYEKAGYGTKVVKDKAELERLSQSIKELLEI